MVSRLVDNHPVRVSPCRLPYALRTELQAMLIQLINTGYIEASSSPYASEVVYKNGKDWDELLDPVMFAYRTAPQASSGETPFSWCLPV